MEAAQSAGNASQHMPRPHLSKSLGTINISPNVRLAPNLPENALLSANITLISTAEKQINTRRRWDSDDLRDNIAADSPMNRYLNVLRRKIFAG